ncbi:unnamed protein product [Acanthocheilonema viteae]|uniref:Uncharacterized protein n=1 Tax=Acanthocheilonema viteae TaxID=6277 RepID=A0A498RY97_ACAVI|nr:unnamed protein product [Acanthocheilonema viteae]
MMHLNGTEIYMHEYGKLQKSKRKQKPDRVNEAEEREEEDSNDDNQDINDTETERTESEELSSRNLKINVAESLAVTVRDDEQRECMKQISMSEAIPPSTKNLRQHGHNEASIPMPRLKKQTAERREEQNQEAYSHISVHERFDIRDMILKPLKNCKQCGYCTPCGIKRCFLNDVVVAENNGGGDVSDAGSQVRLTSRIRRYLPLVQRHDSSVVEDEIDILTPDFTNKRDLTSLKEILLRQKRDQRVLKRRLQAQKRAELAIIAKYEAKQKAISSSIELLLQILQMMTSFAILVGNIRKTFIPAHFKWVKHDNNDSMELMILWRCTVFLDVLLFWISVIWAYCLQCHLCCRLGLLKFWIWILTLGLIGGVFVLYPMSYVQDNLDVSWCRFKPNSSFAHYQPNW